MNKKIRDEIVIQNMNLVSKISLSYSKITGISKEELESYGYEGLILGIDRYDINRGIDFNNFINQSIRWNILNGVQIILLNKHDNFYFDYIDAKEYVETQNGMSIQEYPELINEIIEYLILNDKICDDEESILFTKNKIQDLESLNISFDEKNIDTDLFEDKTDYANIAISSVVKNNIEDYLDSFGELESNIIKLRYGFIDDKIYTYTEIGERLEVPKAKVRRLCEKTIMKLKHPTKTKDLKKYL